MARGLRDDTTCVVVDLMPPDSCAPPRPPLPPVKKHKLKSWLFGSRSKESTATVASKPQDTVIVEHLFEEGSAMLADRFASFNFIYQTIFVIVG